MRPSSRRRVAAWLLALPAGRGREECARRGRLEMISFWLLCWKLLRATAGLRRTTAELTDGNQDNSNPGNSNPVNDSSTTTPPPDSVTMEISSLLPLAETETVVPIGCCSNNAEQLHYPEVHGAQESITNELVEEREEDEEGEEDLEGKDDEEIVGGEHLFKLEGEEIGREDREMLETVVEDGETVEPAGEDGEILETVVEDGEVLETAGEDGEMLETAGEDGEILETVIEDGEVLETAGEDGEMLETAGEDGEMLETLVEDGEVLETAGEDGEMLETLVEDGEVLETAGEDGEMLETAGEEKHTEEEEEESGVFLTSNSPLCLLARPQEVAGSVPSALPVEGWCPDQGDRDDLSDCIQAEFAIVSSDSDTGDDQWVASAACDVTDQEEARDEIQDGVGSEQGKGEGAEEILEEMEVGEGREEEEGVGMEEQGEEKRGDMDDWGMQERPEGVPPQRLASASSTDPDRKFPADFCTPQEASSENVSTEHLDFLLARQQWKKMEEEVKGQPLPQPGVKSQGSFQGTHSSLYPPTRSPRLQRREVHPQIPREPPLSSTVSPSSEDSGLEDFSYRSPLEDPESAVEREIRLTLEREERHRRERGMAAQGLLIPRPISLQTGRSPPRPPACRTPTLSVSPTPAPSSSSSSSVPRPVYHEMTANNVIVLEPDSSHPATRTRLLAPGSFAGWPGGLDAVATANIIVVETSNLIIRSASEFCLSASPPVSVETQESTFSSNPFFKLRSLSSQSLVEREIRVVRQREEEWRRQREEEWRRRREEQWQRGREVESYHTVLVSPGLSENISYNVPEVPDRCVSSPSSPSRTRKMERPSLSCDQKFPPALSTIPRRQNAMALRWEASLLANQKKD